MTSRRLPLATVLAEHPEGWPLGRVKKTLPTVCDSLSWRPTWPALAMAGSAGEIVPAGPLGFVAWLAYFVVSVDLEKVMSTAAAIRSGVQ
jgi:hypothetical protein